MSEKLWNWFEKIDNENLKISEQLDKKEDLVALWIIETIDKQIPNVDIDLAIDRENNKYYFIANNKESLNISFDLNQLPEIWSVLVKLFNNDIQLFWYIKSRSIAKDSLMPYWLEEMYITSNDFTKNDIEELFVFIMKSKWISMEDWQLERAVCANWHITDECKKALWK